MSLATEAVSFIFPSITYLSTSAMKRRTTGGGGGASAKANAAAWTWMPSGTVQRLSVGPRLQDDAVVGERHFGQLPRPTPFRPAVAPDPGDRPSCGRTRRSRDCLCARRMPEPPRSSARRTSVGIAIRERRSRIFARPRLGPGHARSGLRHPEDAMEDLLPHRRIVPEEAAVESRVVPVVAGVEASHELHLDAAGETLERTPRCGPLSTGWRERPLGPEDADELGGSTIWSLIMFSVFWKGTKLIGGDSRADNAWRSGPSRGRSSPGSPRGKGAGSSDRCRGRADSSRSRSA